MTEQQVQAGAVTEPAEKVQPLDNSRLWLLVAAPVLIFAVDAVFLYSGHSDGTVWAVVAAVAVTVALATWDSRYLRGRGVAVSGMSAAWFVPGYLYQRSRLLAQSQAPLAVWIGAAALSVAAGFALDAHFATLDMAGLQTQLATWTDQQTGGTGAVVTCPSKNVYAAGSTFVCSVSDATGSAHLLVKVESGDGTVTWQLIT